MDDDFAVRNQSKFFFFMKIYLTCTSEFRHVQVKSFHLLLKITLKTVKVNFRVS